MGSTDGEHAPDNGLTLGQRFKKLTERNLPMVAIIYVSSAITAVSTFITACVTGGHWYQQHFNWQAGEYAKLAQLHAGYTLEKFEEELGRPSIQIEISKTNLGNLTQNTFQPRSEYWVDAVTDPHNRVVAYAVTSCSPDFTPSFAYWDGEQSRVVSLNETPFLLALSPLPETASVKAYISGSIGPKYYFAIRSADSISANRSYAWGVSNLCPWKPVKSTHPDAWVDWFSSAARRFGTGGNTITVNANELDKVGRDLMSEYAVNTYAETAPRIDFNVYPDQIGANPMLIPPALSQLPWSGP
ncbi:ETEC_3214 domain-containing protein [Streptomyces sp. NPDC056387]|uniref:ETEC_3214 domain-containing protein n=1 Tax=Streptomyces sp. NPDC056387 TaxID=3345803 RepID=UPI0035D6D92D